MRKTYLGLGMSALILIAAGIIFGLSRQQTITSSLSQTEIEGKAVAYAQTRGLQGIPTQIVSRQMTLSEFRTRLDPYGNYAGQENTLIWLVVMRGKVIAQNPPDAKGNASFTAYDNVWVELSMRGEAEGWGAQTPGNELDLNAPPPQIMRLPEPDLTKISQTTVYVERAGAGPQ
jgi:hypothetical protein